MQNSLRSDSCIFAPDADSCELRVSRHPANAIRGTFFPELRAAALPLFQGVPLGSPSSSKKLQIIPRQEEFSQNPEFRNVFSDI